MLDLSSLLEAIVSWLNHDQQVRLFALVGHYLPTITLVNAVLTGVIATVPLTLYREALSEERWVKYLGWAFVIFTVQYALQTVAFWLGSLTWIQEEYLFLLKLIGHCLGSPVNTVLIFAAARLLMNLEPAFPKWVFPAAILAFLMSLLPHLKGFDVNWWSRLPDAGLSAMSLGFLGWALFTNIDPQWNQWPRIFEFAKGEWSDFGSRWRKRFWALLVLSLIWLYAGLNLAFAFNPLLAEYSVEIKQLEIDPLDSYDAATFALAIPFKLFLFVAFMYLIVRSLVFLSPQVLRRTLKGVTEGDLAFVSSSGIVQAVGKSLDADAVHLYFKIPGNLNRKKAVAWLCWHSGSNEAEENFRLRTPFPDESSIAGTVLRKGQLVDRKLLGVEGPIWNEPEEGEKLIRDPGIKSVIAIPIRYHGSIIAGLNIGWTRKHSMTATAMQRIRLIADLLAPVVEGRRELSSVLYLSSWFQRQEIVNPKLGREMLLQRHIKAIYPTLSPTAIGIAVEAGFSPICAVRTDELPARVFEVSKGTAKAKCDMQLAKAFPRRRKVEEFKEDLLIEGVKVGELTFVESKAAELMERPSMVSDWLLRQTVAFMLADAVFDAIRVWLWSILNRLQTDLSTKTSPSILSWFRSVENTAQDAGAAWTVATLTKDKDRVSFGEDEALAVVKSLEGEGFSGGEATGSFLVHHKLSAPQNGIHSVLRLKLSKVDSLFLGIKRAKFGIELRRDWPWRIFLERFAGAAGAGLARMEIGRMREDELHKHGLVMASVITGSLVHQLINMAQSLSANVYGLRDTTATEGNEVTEPVSLKIDSMASVVEKLEEVTNSIGKLTDLDRSRPCAITVAVERSMQLYGPQLDRMGITYTIDVPKELRVNVPLYVLSLAISNLVSNSQFVLLKARTVEARIEILAEDFGGIVHCRVIDNGPGVDPGIRDKIFELNTTTKPGSNGLGLYLSRHSLRENGGDVILAAESVPGRTEFTIILPKG